ncbi:hypothetical protein RDABS01_015013 [Bienertia sinuspersici]
MRRKKLGFDGEKPSD